MQNEQKCLFLFCLSFFLFALLRKKETHVRYTFSFQNHTDHIHTPTSLYECNNALENKQSQEIQIVPRWYQEVAKYLSAPQ